MGSGLRRATPLPLASRLGFRAPPGLHPSLCSWPDPALSFGHRRATPLPLFRPRPPLSSGIRRASPLRCSHPFGHPPWVPGSAGLPEFRTPLGYSPPSVPASSPLELRVPQRVHELALESGSSGLILNVLCTLVRSGVVPWVRRRARESEDRQQSSGTVNGDRAYDQR